MAKLRELLNTNKELIDIDKILNRITESLNGLEHEQQELFEIINTIKDDKRKEYYRGRFEGVGIAIRLIDSSTEY